MVGVGFALLAVTWLVPVIIIWASGGVAAGLGVFIGVLYWVGANGNRLRRNSMSKRGFTAGIVVTRD